MTDLEDKIRHYLKQKLPGFEAQNRMAPLSRKGINDYPERVPLNSAVLILIYPKNNEPHFILMARQEYNGAHSGQISLPGGKFEESDLHYENTALREANEEIGIDIASLSVLGCLTELYIPVSNFMVHPVLAITHKVINFKIDESEVKHLIEVPISSLMDDTIVTEEDVYMAIIGKHKKVPCFNIQGNTVWGATAMMLSELKELIRASGF